MKIKFTLATAVGAALALNVSTGSGQVFSSADVMNNRAVAASPRAKEEFPGLTRTAPSVTSAKSFAPNIGNQALAASPRVLEVFPELTRPLQPTSVSQVSAASTVLKNRALAASPRAREEFPWLARGNFTVTEEPFEIAPVK